MLPSRYRIAERGAGRWPPRREGVVPPLWSAAPEPYPGALVLEDLARTTGDAAAAGRVLARFAALRVARLAADGLTAAPLEHERSAALPYIAALPPGAEADRLRALLHAHPGAELVAALRAAAAPAAPHIAGAFALLRSAWAHALAQRLHGLAAAAARDIAALARATGFPEEAAAWEGRAAEAGRADT